MGGSRTARLFRFVVLGGLVLNLVPWPVRAESAVWTLTASPLAVTTGAATTFSLRATNEDPLADVLSSSEIGCLWVDVPSNFSVAGASIGNSSAGDSWTVARAGNRVQVHATSGGDRLQSLDWVTFTIRATAVSTGSAGWNGKAYRQQDCSGTSALLGVPPVVIVSNPPATPTPTPSPTPTPIATPTPTPLIVLPTLPLPTLTQPTATPRPGPTATTGPSASATPTAGSEEPDPSPILGTGGTTGSSASPEAGAPAAPSGGDPGADSGAPRVAFDRTNVNLGIGLIDFLDGAEVWAVPAATIGVPGLLLLLWVGLQAIGALAWIPAVRRLRGEDRPRA